MTTHQVITKASEIIDHGLMPVLLGREGDALKIPQLKGWQVAEYTAAEVTQWPTANNVGIRCGRLPDGQYLYVWDFDARAEDIFPEFMKAMGVMLQSPVIVTTGKGYHLYIITDEKQPHGTYAAEIVRDGDKNRQEIIIEVRGEHQQVVSPGSRHPSGKRYELQAGDLANIPTISSNDYQQLMAIAKSYDKRQQKQPQANRQPGTPKQPNTMLQGIYNCLDYARSFIAGQIRQETDGQYRVLGNGGLLITENKQAWYCHADGIGGGLADLIAWHRGVTSTGDLARQIFGANAAMVAPMREYFSGDYPISPDHTCRHYMEVTAGEDNIAHHRLHTSKLWRPRKVGGYQMIACPGCQHDYAWRVAKQLEYEAAAYDISEMPFRYQILKPAQAKKMLKAARKWRDHGFELRYWMRPLKGGRTVLIHNVHGVAAAYGIDASKVNRFDRKAHDLPQDRQRLLELIEGWIVDANTSKTSHSKGWGGDFKGTRGDGREDKEEREMPLIAIVTNWQAARDAIADYLRLEDFPHETGLHIVDFVNILDAAGVTYGVGKGQERLEVMKKARSVHKTVLVSSPMYGTCPEEERPPPGGG